MSDIGGSTAQPLPHGSQHSQKGVSGHGDRVWNLAERGKNRRGRGGRGGGRGQTGRGRFPRRTNAPQHGSQNLFDSDAEWESQRDSDEYYT